MYVPVWYICGLAVHQRRYDIAERGQGEVDLGGLLQTIASSTSLYAGNEYKYTCTGIAVYTKLSSII